MLRRRPQVAQGHWKVRIGMHWMGCRHECLKQVLLPSLAFDISRIRRARDQRWLSRRMNRILLRCGVMWSCSTQVAAGDSVKLEDVPLHSVPSHDTARCLWLRGREDGFAPEKIEESASRYQRGVHESCGSSEKSRIHATKLVGTTGAHFDELRTYAPSRTRGEDVDSDHTHTRAQRA